MTPDTYKPVLSVVVLPVNSNDTFQPGEYFSPRLQNNAGSELNDPHNTLMFLFSAVLTRVFDMNLAIKGH